MAERIVDDLEVIEIQEQDREWTPPGQRLAEAIEEERPVGQPGEEIEKRLAREPSFENLAGRYILGDSENCRPPAKVERMGGSFNVDQMAISEAVPPRPGAETPR